MITQTSITQSYVLTETGKEITLKYSLVCNESQYPDKCYGIHIEQVDEGGTYSVLVMISANKEDVIQDIHYYARNFVFPVSLNDIVKDA